MKTKTNKEKTKKKCCDKCHDIDTEHTYPAHTITEFCRDHDCECHNPPQQIEKVGSEKKNDYSGLAKFITDNTKCSGEVLTEAKFRKGMKYLTSKKYQKKVAKEYEMKMKGQEILNKPPEQPEETSPSYEAQLSRLLQHMEGMEFLSPVLRRDIEILVIKTVREQLAQVREEAVKPLEEKLKFQQESIKRLSRELNKLKSELIEK